MRASRHYRVHCKSIDSSFLRKTLFKRTEPNDTWKYSTNSTFWWEQIRILRFLRLFCCMQSAASLLLLQNTPSNKNGHRYGQQDGGEGPPEVKPPRGGKCVTTQIVTEQASYSCGRGAERGVCVTFVGSGAVTIRNFWRWFIVGKMI